MNKILIISPCFPPVNTPDHHRIRLSIPHFIKQGWDVTVLAVAPQYIEAPIDPVLSQLPDLCKVIRVSAFPAKWTRKIGLGNLGYRCLYQMYHAGNQLLKSEKFDLIYFSTTVFPVMTLGRIWKKKFKIPFIVDLQDPWRNDFYLDKPKQLQPPKYKIAHFLDSLLEKWTLPYSDGIVSVSQVYPKTIFDRYKLIIPFVVIPFASCMTDFEVVKNLRIVNSIFTRKKGRIHVVYTGAITPGMPEPLQLMLSGFKTLFIKYPELDIHLYFVGTSYALSSRSIALPIGNELEISDHITELPDRIGYFEAIRVMLDADFLILPGSLEAGYTASKIYPYILSGKPIIALTHFQSSVSTILKGCNSGTVITFNNENDLKNKKDELVKVLENIIKDGSYQVNTNWNYYHEFSDMRMSEKQLAFFKLILNENETQQQHNCN